MFTEKQIQSGILEYLGYKQIFHFRNNSGATLASYKGKSRMIRFGTPGSPDIICVINGLFIGLEVKNAKNKQSDLQKSFQLQLEKSGGKYFLVRSIEDVEVALTSLMR